MAWRRVVDCSSAGCEVGHKKTREVRSHFSLRIRPALNFPSPHLYLNLIMAKQWLDGECPSSEGEEDVVLVRDVLEAWEEDDRQIAAWEEGRQNIAELHAWHREQEALREEEVLPVPNPNGEDEALPVPNPNGEEPQPQAATYPKGDQPQPNPNGCQPGMPQMTAEQWRLQNAKRNMHIMLNEGAEVTVLRWARPKQKCRPVRNRLRQRPGLINAMIREAWRRSTGGSLVQVPVQAGSLSAPLAWVAG